MLITISQTTPNPPIRYLGTQPHLRGWYSQRFVAGDGVTPVEPGNGQSGFYYDIPCSKNGDGNLVIPTFEIQSTTDGNNPTSRFTGQLYEQSGAPREIIFGNIPGNSGWQITTLYGDNVDWADLFRYNQAARLLNPPPTYFTAEQVIREILALAGQFDYARVGHLGLVEMRDAPDVASEPTAIGDNSWAEVDRAGIAELDTAPVDAEHPIAVGANSPLLVNGGALIRGVKTLDLGGSVAVLEAQTELDSPILVLPLSDTVTGNLRAITRSTGVGFVIVSDNGADSGDVAWLMYSSI